MDYPGNDIGHVFVPTAVECQQKCKEEKRCMFFGYIKSDKKCYLKDSKATPSAHQDRVSGPKTCPFMKHGNSLTFYQHSSFSLTYF